jgi:PhnB protein
MLAGGRCRRKTKHAIRIGCRLDGAVDHDALIEQFDRDRPRVGHPRNLSRSFSGHSRTLAQWSVFGPYPTFGCTGTDTFAQLVVASITPVLTVRSTAAAVEFYEAAFGAIEISRVKASDGQLVIDLAIGQARFRVVDEAPKAFNLSPETLGGTSVRLNLLVEDPDATAAQAMAAGAVEVFPIADQPYGLRQGRFADPFGHHWLIGKPLPLGSPR